MTYSDKCQETFANDAISADVDGPSGCGGADGTRGCVTMESGGTIDETSPDYVEDDDVMNSMAEGYY